MNKEKIARTIKELERKKDKFVHIYTFESMNTTDTETVAPLMTIYAQIIKLFNI